MTANAELLELDEVTTGFGANQVLHGVTLSLPPGLTGALLGLNGAGKSVTLRTVIGLQPAWSGAIRFDGRELGHREAEDRVRAGLGHVVQSKNVFANLTVAENLRLGGAVVRDRLRRSANLERVFAIYPLLAERRTQVAGTLSGGEQAMLAVGRALMADPRLLLVDEPSAGLAPKMVGRLGETLRKVRETGTTLLIVEQNVGFALELADEVFVMERGKVVYRGQPGELDRDRLASLLGIGVLLRGPVARLGTRRTRPLRSTTHNRRRPA